MNGSEDTMMDDDEHYHHSYAWQPHTSTEIVKVPSSRVIFRQFMRNFEPLGIEATFSTLKLALSPTGMVPMSVLFPGMKGAYSQVTKTGTQVYSPYEFPIFNVFVSPVRFGSGFIDFQDRDQVAKLLQSTLAIEEEEREDTNEILIKVEYVDEPKTDDGVAKSRKNRKYRITLLRSEEDLKETGDLTKTSVPPRQAKHSGRNQIASSVESLQSVLSGSSDESPDDQDDGKPDCHVRWEMSIVTNISRYRR